MRKINRRAGFTLIEMVIVMVLMGTLSVIAAPMFNTKDLDNAFFKNQVMTLIRYSQRVAVSSRSYVQIRPAACPNAASQTCLLIFLQDSATTFNTRLPTASDDLMITNPASVTALTTFNATFTPTGSLGCPTAMTPCSTAVTFRLNNKDTTIDAFSGFVYEH